MFDFCVSFFMRYECALHWFQGVRPKSAIVSLDGTLAPAIMIFTFAIRYLKEHLLATLEEEDWCVSYLGIGSRINMFCKLV